MVFLSPLPRNFLSSFPCGLLSLLSFVVFFFIGCLWSLVPTQRPTASKALGLLLHFASLIFCEHHNQRIYPSAIHRYDTNKDNFTLNFVKHLLSIYLKKRESKLPYLFRNLSTPVQLKSSFQSQFKYEQTQCSK